MAGTLAVELAEAVADVAAGLVVGHELLGLEAVGASVAHVDARHNAGSSSKDLQKWPVSYFLLTPTELPKAPPCLPNQRQIAISGTARCQEKE